MLCKWGRKQRLLSAGNADSIIYLLDNWKPLLSPSLLPGLPFGHRSAPFLCFGTVTTLDKTSCSKAHLQSVPPHIKPTSTTGFCPTGLSPGVGAVQKNPAHFIQGLPLTPLSPLKLHSNLFFLNAFIHSTNTGVTTKSTKHKARARCSKDCLLVMSNLAKK